MNTTGENRMMKTYRHTTASLYNTLLPNMKEHNSNYSQKMAETYS
jgi:hypothetical protein